MSRALRLLGLGPDADERAIKRAYAARLKTTRPDNDPEGFQALNEAYQAALDWVRSRGNATQVKPMASMPENDIDEDAPAESVGTVTRILSQDALFSLIGAQHETQQSPDQNIVSIDAHAHEHAFTHLSENEPNGGSPAAVESQTETAHFDPDTFFEACIAPGVRNRDGELLNWLNAQPALWSLEHKAKIGHWLLRALHKQCPPLEAGRFDVIADFFGILELNSGYDAHTVQRLRHRLNLTWELHTDQLQALAQRTGVGLNGGSVASNMRLTKRILNQVRRPLNIAQALFAGLVPTYPTSTLRFLYQLDAGNLDDLPPPINSSQVAFWKAAGNRARFSWQRLLIGASRCVGYALFAMMLTGFIKPFTPEAGIDFQIVAKTGLICFVAMLCGWLTWICSGACLQWQCMSHTEVIRFRWLHLALIPILVSGALLAERVFELTAVGIALLAIAFLMALQRYRARNGAALGIRLASKGSRLLLIFFGISALAVIAGFAHDSFHGFAPAFPTPGISIFVLALWAVDLYKQHASQRS